MTVLSAGFEKASEVVRHEHQALTSELNELEACLNALVCYSEVYADLAPMERVYRCGRHLRSTLPEHFRNEEATVLADVEAAMPQLRPFVHQMRRQHGDLQGSLNQFCRLLTGIEETPDLEQTICEIKERGLSFAKAMLAHMCGVVSRIAQLPS